MFYFVDVSFPTLSNLFECNKVIFDIMFGIFFVELNREKCGSKPFIVLFIVQFELFATPASLSLGPLVGAFVGAI